jgi:putative hydroxymethylpyrimidine transport system substrate-binding protein
MNRLRSKLLVIGLTASLGACTTAISAWAANCAGPSEVGSLTLMADWLPWASQGPMVAAQLAGFYKDEGIELKIMAPANPADPIKLVAREKINFSFTYVPEVMLSRETGIPVIAVATTLRVLSSGLFSTEEANINKPADLKGKTLGVGPKLDAQAYLATLLAAGGLTKNDVKVVDPGYAHVPMMLAGKIDAAHGLTYAEGVLANEELAKLNRKPVHWLLYRDYGVPPFYYQVIVSNENWVKNHPNAVCRFLRATSKGLDVWLTKPDAAETQIAKANDQFTPEQHQKIYEATKDHWKTKDNVSFHQDLDIWKEAQDWAIKQKLLTLSEDPNHYFTNAYLP